MAVQDLSYAEIVNEAYRRAIPAKKFVKLLSRANDQRDVADQLASALLDQLFLHPTPPTLILSYLSQCLSDSAGTPVLPPHIFLIHFLFRLNDHLISSTPTSSLAVICSTLLFPLATSLDPLPGELHYPASLIPEIGSSTSGSPQPTLRLVLPLLRLCSNGPPAPIVSLTARILSLVQPYPAPPLDVGLEAGGMLQALPEVLSTPLRDSLGGLMADLAISQDSGMGLALDGMTGMDDVIPNHNDSSMHGDSNAQPMSLPPLDTDPSSIPLSQSLAFLLEYLHASSRWTRSIDSPSQLLLRLAPYIASDPVTFLTQLLETSFLALSTPSSGSPADIDKWLFFIEGLPALLQSWKQLGDLEFPYPDKLPAILRSFFESQSSLLGEINTFMAQHYDTLIATVDSEDDTGGYVAPDGWSLCALEVTLLLRLIQLDLLSRQDAKSILPEVTIPISSNGESLVNRVATASRSHLPPLAHLIVYTPGAARAFATEVLAIIQSSSSNAPPDDLFSHLAASPSLIACLVTVASPASLLDLLETNLLNRPDDVNTRADDPQGSLTRFGEGVMLVEAAVHAFKLPVPRLLAEGRRARSLGDWGQTEKGLLNGWIKALFGSDGIDDQTLSATSPQDFYRLAPSLIQQAVVARAAGQIDIDTLQSGLSYFSQDLLSWSLGGIVAWLCEEVVRNGPVSGLHLQVLQRLLLGDTFPGPLLRVAGNAVAQLLNPMSGLQDVFASSGFDEAAVRAKLQSAGLDADPVPTLSFAQRITNLRLTMQSMRPPDSSLQQSGWTTTLLPAYESCVAAIGEADTLQLILTETLLTSSLNGDSADPLGLLASIMTVLGLGRGHAPLLPLLVDVALPALFEDDSALAAVQAQLQPYAALTLAKLIKQSLLIASDLHAAAPPIDNVNTAGFGQMDMAGVVQALVDEMEYQRSRRLWEPPDLPQAKRAKKTKRGRHGGAGGVMPIGKAQRAVLEMVVHALAGDEMLRERWPVFERLA